MAMAASGVKLPNPWEAVGRGTEIGRTLFALYNGYGLARNRGNKYSDVNRMKIMERISNEDNSDEYLIPPDPPKPKKAIVKVPHFRKKCITIDDIPQVLLMRGRKKSSKILSQMKEEMLHQDQPPAPKKPLLDEKEKARLQEIFEWSGRDIGEDEEDQDQSDISTSSKVPPPPARGSVEEQEMLIEAIAKEIEDRKDFLDKMYQLGRGSKYEPIIRLEIQERVRQMELLDKNITLMDRERLENQSHKSARSSQSNQSRHTNKQEKITPQSQSSVKDPKQISFEEQLNAIRQEQIINKTDGSPISLHALNDEDRPDKDSLVSSKFSPETIDKFDAGNNLHHELFKGTKMIKEHPKSLNLDLSECDSVSTSSKSSALDSESIRSSLKSVNSQYSVTSKALSTLHSTP